MHLPSTETQPLISPNIGEALIFESTLAHIPPPDRKTLKAFRFNFFRGRPGQESAFPMLGGPSSGLYDDPDDLVALQVAEDPDRLTMFVRNNLGFMFQVMHFHGITHYDRYPC